MNVPDFIEWAEEIQSRENKIMLLKGEEYTVSDEDKFKNFKSIADRTDSTAEKVALIYLLKHMDSIRNYVLHGKEASDEPIMGRIMDARNYLLLLGGIINENGDLSPEAKAFLDKDIGIKRAKLENQLKVHEEMGGKVYSEGNECQE
jgi:hypothetical protein